MPKVLVADDSIAVRKVAERLLTEAGFGVALAANGEEAMAYLAKDRPDMIVSDVIMPDRSGYEVCAFVRANAVIATVPVLLISGIVNDEVTKQAESCHADGVLKKPFQGTSLKDKVLELIAKRQSQTAASILKPAVAPISPQPAASAQAPVSGFKPRQTQPVSIANSGDSQAAMKLKETEEQLRIERARADSFATRIADLEATVGRGRETEGLLEAERRLVNELESKVAASALQVSRIPQLEAALRDEQELSAKARQEVAVLKDASSRIEQLEAALGAEREMAEQLAQQVTELEAVAVRGNNAEAMLAREVERAAEFERKARESEAALAVCSNNAEAMLAREVERAAEFERKARESEVALGAVQARMGELTIKAADAEHAAKRIGELEVLLAMERERNAVLARRVSESEQVAVIATKRFEAMARKLGEIAGLASQLGKGMG